ncbi:GNAT family N-acetyltransferase [Vibrio sp. CK2-1]|uniref:GNAT family N-acetyltransferase n=1 Tax=Vibrio sp. CK2-1 TaxID=2912249 RepID=UPI001F00B87A|nr:GNAT family N-acetyltransferase [Vibrio sp. CK2-1]MCF7352728.1 GNAT family N-acetyltransferase [Vibrio sp. CK2-1]
MITIRPYQPEDAQILWQLFFNTVRQINVRDYTQAQVEAWAEDKSDLTDWIEKMKGNQPFVATLNDKIVGYADLQGDGYINHFFCHHQYQGCGVGKALMLHIHEQAKQRNLARLHADVSMTAKPFFEHAGFIVKEKQSVSLRGQQFTNYRMEKCLAPLCS